MSKKINWRQKRDAEWHIWVNDNGTVDPDALTNFLLLDIREELKELNRTFACRSFQSIPRELRAIKRNTTKKKVRR